MAANVLEQKALRAIRSLGKDGTAAQLSHKLRSLLPADKRGCISEEGLQRKARRWLDHWRKATTTGRRSAIARQVAEYIGQDPVTWVAIIRVGGLVIPPGEKLAFGKISVYHVDERALVKITENLLNLANEREVVLSHFDSATCCEIEIEHHSEDMVGAGQKAIEQVGRRIAVLRLGVRAAMDVSDDPLPFHILPNSVLLRRKKGRGQWYLLQGRQPKAIELTEENTVIIKRYHSDCLNMDIGLAKRAPRARRKTVQLSKLLSEVRLLMGIAEGETVELSKFLRYMTALERLLATREVESTSITQRLALRGSALYHPRHVPGRLEKLANIGPQEIVELYNLRSISHHRGNQSIDHTDLEMLRSLCHATFLAALGFLESHLLSTTDDLATFIDSCCDILAIVGIGDPISKLTGHYARIARRALGRTRLNQALAFLEANELLIISDSPQDVSLTPRGEAIFNYISRPPSQG